VDAVWRDELMDGTDSPRSLDDRIRAAVVAEPPPELRFRLAAVGRGAPARGALVLALALCQAILVLASSTLVLGNVADAAALLTALPTLPSLQLVGLDPLSAALWCVVGVVVWLAAEREPRRGRERTHA
jgi:hypothetical protein